MRSKGIAWWIEVHPAGVAAADASGTVLHEADDLAGLKGKVSGRVALLLGRRVALIKTARLPNARPGELRTIVALQARQMFPTVQGEMAFGHLLTDNTQQDGRLAILAAAPVSTLERLYAQAASIGATVALAVPAAAGAMALARSMGIRHALVAERTAEGLALDVVEHGALVYTRVVPPEASVAQEIERTWAAAGVPEGTVISGPGLPATAHSIGEGESSLAALRGHASEFESFHLEPPAVTERRERALVAGRARLAILMAVAAVGLAAVVWDARDQEEIEARKERASFEVALRKWTKVRDEASKKASRYGTLAEEIQRAFEPAQRVGDVLTVVGNETPRGVWLTGVTYERGKPILVRGVATNNESVGQYLDRLTGNDRFRDVKLVFANQALIESSSVVQFSMSAHVVGNLPAAKTKQERSKSK